MSMSVKAARVNANLTQEQVAGELKISLSAYKRKEQGYSKFYVDEAVVLSKLFGVEISIFFNSRCLEKTHLSA